MFGLNNTHLLLRSRGINTPQFQQFIDTLNHETSPKHSPMLIASYISQEPEFTPLYSTACYTSLGKSNNHLSKVGVKLIGGMYPFPSELHETL